MKSIVKQLPINQLFMGRGKWVCRLVLTLLVAAACHISAAAQSKLLSEQECKQITFKWTDKSGKTHTSNLAETATEPEHIFALIKEVYTNPKVPGILYGGYKADGVTREGLAYYTAVPAWGITSVTPPSADNEGYTVLLIKVKDSWTVPDNVDANCTNVAQVVNAISQRIESAEVITDAERNNTGNNPGTLFRVSGAANRFYFISKGRARLWDTGLPVNRPFLFQMFEQYSPVLQSSSIALMDYYKTMAQGTAYSVQHDCGTVTGNTHWFSMSGTSGNRKYDVSDLVFYIPDKRLQAFSDRDQSSMLCSNYNPAFAPRTSLYTVRLTADTAKVDGKDEYTVTLRWSSSLAKIIGYEIGQRFHLYKVEDNGDKTPLDTVDNAFTYSYVEPQQQHGRQLTYIITAQPIDSAASLSAVWSNESSVAIPGIDPFESLTLGVGGSSTSHYDATKEQNQYANFVKMNNGVGTNVRGMGVTTASKFTFYRTDELGTRTPIATLAVTAKTDTTIDYSVSYSNQSGAVADKYPASTGRFTIDSLDVVDFGDFTVCDQFGASTVANTQSAYYRYKVTYAPDGADEKYYSNDFDVKVYKTAITAATPTISKADADGDTDHSLEVAATNGPLLSFAVENNPNIQKYELWRTTYGGSTAIVGRAQRTMAGKYATFEIENGTDHSVATDISGKATMGDRTFSGAENAAYVPVISVYAADSTAEANTYGCSKVKADGISLRGKAVYCMQSDYIFNNRKGRYYSTDLLIDAEVPAGVTVERYRVWRDCNGDAMEEVPAYNYRTNPLWAYCDTLTADDEILTTDLFGARRATAGSPLAVSYLARLYGKVDGTDKYYVAQLTIPVTFNGDEPTAVTPAVANHKVVAVRYTNQLGQESATPFTGFNVVTTTYASGLRTVHKRMIPAK